MNTWTISAALWVIALCQVLKLITKWISLSQSSSPSRTEHEEKWLDNVPRRRWQDKIRK